MAFELLPLPYPNSALEPRMSLRSPGFYREHVIDLKLGARAIAIDAKKRQVDGNRHYYDALLIANGLILRASRFPVRTCRMCTTSAPSPTAAPSSPRSRRRVGSWNLQVGRQ